MAKLDGVIEAVRYKAGRIDIVRAYERRGATFSDHVLLDRKTLIERLEQGKRFFAGQRKEFLGSTFDLGKQVSLEGQVGKQVITTGTQGDQDQLEGVPDF